MSKFELVVLTLGGISILLIFGCYLYCRDLHGDASTGSYD